jgi:hypothetical protein
MLLYTLIDLCVTKARPGVSYCSSLDGRVQTARNVLQFRVRQCCNVETSFHGSPSLRMAIHTSVERVTW